MSSELTTWETWRTRHPETFALDVPSGTSDVDVDQLAVVIQLGDVSAAFPIPAVRAAGVVNTEVDGTPIAITADSKTNSWAAFYRQANNRTVRLELVENEAGLAELAEIGRAQRWDPATGLTRTPLSGATDEARARQHLDLFPASTSFLDDYRRFHPDGLIWEGSELVSVGD